MNQIDVLRSHSWRSTYRNPPGSACSSLHKSNCPTAYSVSHNVSDHLLHQTSNQVCWEVTNDLMRHYSITCPPESWGVLSLWSQQCTDTNSVCFKVTAGRLVLRCWTLKHSVDASFMCHEAGVVKYWRGIRCWEAILVERCHLEATKPTVQHHDTKTQKAQQNRANTWTEQNTVKITTHSRARLKDYW